MTHEDDRERYDEQRFVSVGQAVNGVLVVIHTIVTDEPIHVISARRAEPYEARHYWKEFARYKQPMMFRRSPSDSLPSCGRDAGKQGQDAHHHHDRRRRAGPVRARRRRCGR